MCKCLCGVLEWLSLGLMVPHPHTGLLSGCACSCTGSQSSPVLFKKVTFSSTLTIHCFLDESPSDSEVESLCINQPLSKEASSLNTVRFCGCRLLKQWVVAGSYCGFYSTAEVDGSFHLIPKLWRLRFITAVSPSWAEMKQERHKSCFRNPSENYPNIYLLNLEWKEHIAPTQGPVSTCLLSSYPSKIQQKRRLSSTANTQSYTKARAQELSAMTPLRNSLGS